MANEPTEVEAHYESLLAEVYDWMQGGWDIKADAARSLFELLEVSGSTAVDLGAGTGYQSIPLAEMGFEIKALDSSAEMLAQLSGRAEEFAIAVVHDDIANFGAHITVAPDLIVCMGDTLSHLASHSVLSELLNTTYEALAPGGTLVLSFRGGVVMPESNGRFLPIRSDADRIFTCFIEEVDADYMRVHDVLHTRLGEGFTQHVSSYNKLRLDPERIAAELQSLGFEQSYRDDANGFVTLAVTKP